MTPEVIHNKFKCFDTNCMTTTNTQNTQYTLVKVKKLNEKKESLSSTHTVNTSALPQFVLGTDKHTSVLSYTRQVTTLRHNSHNTLLLQTTLTDDSDRRLWQTTLADDSGRRQLHLARVHSTAVSTQCKGDQSCITMCTNHKSTLFAG